MNINDFRLLGLLPTMIFISLIIALAMKSEYGGSLKRWFFSALQLVFIVGICLAGIVWAIGVFNI